MKDDGGKKENFYPESTHYDTCRNRLINVPELESDTIPPQCLASPSTPLLAPVDLLVIPQ